jgi:hypothetical protein
MMTAVESMMKPFQTLKDFQLAVAVLSRLPAVMPGACNALTEVA